jgi:hypothetical protein
MKAKNLLIVFKLINLLYGCVICNDISWYGNVPVPIGTKKDSILPYVSFEQHTKQINLLPFMIFKNLDGYNLYISLLTNSNKFQKVDSITFSLSTFINEPLL